MENKLLSNSSDSSFAWIGYPDETGVKNVGGRLGAQKGPEAFLTSFKKLNGKQPISTLNHESRLCSLHEDLETNYDIACEETRRLLRQKGKAWVPLIAVGGGHDYAYPWIRAWREKLGSKAKLGCINIDAHFDLREYKDSMTSGSPFRRLIDEKILDPKNLIEFGVQDHCNASELWKFAKDKKVGVVPWNQLRGGKALARLKAEFKKLKARCDVILVSFDLDAVSMAYAPGVSAPQAEGLSATEAFQILEFLGSDKKVTSLGIFELAPALDVYDLTARFSAQAAWHFLSSKLK